MDFEAVFCKFPMTCCECGREFKPGDEYYILQRVVMKNQSHTTTLVRVMSEKLMCTYDCAPAAESWSCKG